MNKAANAVRTVDLSKFDVVVKDAEDNAAAAVRAGGFDAASWRQVALDVDRHGDKIDTGQLSDIIDLVLHPPAPPPPKPKPKKKIVKKVSHQTHTDTYHLPTPHARTHTRTHTHTHTHTHTAVTSTTNTTNTNTIYICANCTI